MSFNVQQLALPAHRFPLLALVHKIESGSLSGTSDADSDLEGPADVSATKIEDILKREKQWLLLDIKHNPIF